ncbi:MAG: ParB/RepB/Spo0J family partition protein [Proteobacteria bacterium]|nr:ParB/RepB/Spo0J family partition protein [Pseudomonadota bacterium]
MEEARKRVLGRGISALIPGGVSAPRDRDQEILRSDGIREINLDEIQPGANQPRTEFDADGIAELAESIRRHGVLHPIIVQDVDGQYRIIAGERRWRAAQVVGLRSIPCVVKQVSNGESAEIALVENIQRQNISALEEARAYIRLMEEFGYSYDDIAQKLGKSKSHVINTIRVTKLPLEVQKLLQERKITAGHARAILAHADPLSAAKEIIDNALSVRDSEKLARDSHASAAAANDSQRRKRKARNSADSEISGDGGWLGDRADIAEIEQMLSSTLGVSVTITNDGASGSLIVNFTNLAELDNLIYKLGRVE